MTRYLRILILFLAFSVAFAFQQPMVHAQSSGEMVIAQQTPPPIFTGMGNENNQRANRYTLANIRDNLLPALARWGGGFIGAIAVLALIWAGVRFLTAGGDSEKIAQAGKTAFYVIAALLLMMFAYVLVYLFLTIFTPPTEAPPS